MLMEAIDLNNTAQSLSQSGRHQDALKLFQEALRLKIKACGTHSKQAALSYNALGECYMELHQYDLARTNLEAALAFRQTEGETLDTRVTRENLGRVCEEMGDLHGAREHRNNGTNLCANNTCMDEPPENGLRLFSCSRCKAIYYCCKDCQKEDWKRHKVYCKVLSAGITTNDEQVNC